MSLLVRHARAVDAGGVVDDAWLLVEGEVIRSVGTGEPGPGLLDKPVDVVDAHGDWVTPGFIDLHAHGASGHRFEDPGADLGSALAVHRRRGTTRSVLSLASDRLEVLEASLARIADWTTHDELVLGSHLEGPYLSPQRSGVHDPETLRRPNLTETNALLAAAAGTLRQLTIAPELPGALTVIGRIVADGVVAAIGHTDATYEQTRSAFDAGGRLLTHAHNAMPGIGHRAPGPVVAAFDDDRIRLEVIADGHHVDPRVLALTFANATGRVAMVSDAMAATGLGDGTYTLGRREVRVRDGIARLAGTDMLAGATQTLDESVRRAVAAGISPAVAVGAVTSVPATVLGMDDRLGSLRPGHAADIVVLDPSWRVRRVFAAGREIT